MDRVTAASYAPLVMYAWDMSDLNLHVVPAVPDPRIAGRGYTVLGYLSASDDIYKAGDSIRSTVLGAGDRVCYGYVAKNAQEIVVAIRGTDGAQEWADDLDFVMQHFASNGAVSCYVDQGFYQIYAGLKFHPLPTSIPLSPIANDPFAVPAIAGIKEVCGALPVRVLGHSLGAAIATYLTLELNLAAQPASACLFASPRTGNAGFINFFEQNVPSYDLFNYEHDVVPRVPRFDILHFSAYKALVQEKVIPAGSSSAAIQDDPACNHHLICYTALLDTATYTAEMSDRNVTADDIHCAKCVISG